MSKYEELAIERLKSSLNDGLKLVSGPGMKKAAMLWVHGEKPRPCCRESFGGWEGFMTAWRRVPTKCIGQCPEGGELSDGTVELLRNWPRPDAVIFDDSRRRLTFVEHVHTHDVPIEKVFAYGELVDVLLGEIEACVIRIDNGGRICGALNAGLAYVEGMANQAGISYGDDAMRFWGGVE